MSAIRSVTNWDSIENIAEGTIMSCMLSEHPYLLIFMQYIFVRLTRVMYGAFILFNENKNKNDAHNDAILQIINKFKPEYDRNFLLRPGLDSTSNINLIKMINNIIENGCDNEILNTFSLNQIMGAIYGITTDRFIIGKIILASTFKEFQNIFKNDINNSSIDIIINTIKNILGLPKILIKIKKLQELIMKKH